MIEHAQLLEELYNPARKNFTRTTGIEPDENGKLKGTQRPANRALKAEDLEAHLDGSGPMVGFYQFLDDERVGFVGLDVDDYDVNVRDVCQKIRRWRAPFLASRTKSGGLHLECFSAEPMNAKDAREKLRQWGEAFGFSSFELFPKQDSAPNLGSALQVPMYRIRTGEPLTYFYDDEGEPILDVQEALNRIDEARKRKLVSPPLFDGPPCLQRHALDGVPDGSGRGVVLFNVGVMFKQMHGDDREEIRDAVEDFNDAYIHPPKTNQNCGQIASSVVKNDYSFQCREEPLARFCNQELCKRRDFGIGGGRPEGAVEIPSNHYSFRECADDVFARFRDSQELFRRGGEVAEVADNEIKLVSAAAFQSRIEKAGKLVRRTVSQKTGKLGYSGALLSAQHATALLAAEARELLHDIKLVSPVPLLNADGSILSPGFNAESGVLVSGDMQPQMMGFVEARDTLLDLLNDFDFLHESDRSRAMANIITATLRLSGLLPFPIPFDYSDAVESQSGKTLRQAITRTIFDVHVPVSAEREKGIGSLDDELAAQFYKGKPFVVIDNHKGRYDSPYIEAALTSPDQIVNVRMMRRDALPVDIGRQVLQFSSNDAELSEDMLNRALIVTIRKRPSEYLYTYPQLLDHVAANREMYLGACLSIGAHAIKNIEPDFSFHGHDLRQWLAHVGPIIEAMELEPLTSNHEAKKERISGKRGGNFLLQVVTHMEEGREYTAHEIVEDVISAHAIRWPGDREPADDKAMRQRLGQILAGAFGDESRITVEEFELHRMIEQRQKKNRTWFDHKTYRKGDEKSVY